MNGEIYNHEALKAGLKGKHTFATASDCEIIAHLVRQAASDGGHKCNSSNWKGISPFRGRCLNIAAQHSSMNERHPVSYVMPYNCFTRMYHLRCLPALSMRRLGRTSSSSWMASSPFPCSTRRPTRSSLHATPSASAPCISDGGETVRAAVHGLGCPLWKLACNLLG